MLYITLCMLGNFTCRLLIFFPPKVPSAIQSVSNSLDPVRSDAMFGLIWIQTIYKRLSADDTSVGKEIVIVS